MGSPMSFVDLDRVRASEAKMVFILADFNSPYPDEDDEKNILYTASLARICSMTPYRLMLTRIQNLATANDVGLSMHNRYATLAFLLRSASLPAVGAGGGSRVPAFAMCNF